ncbi:MAG: hypothetical protein QOE68_3539 [Thermoanaerobaculia bacterium]|nr:hypothetical protein [Thermoanaerobaculia bacterium]
MTLGTVRNRCSGKTKGHTSSYCSARATVGCVDGPEGQIVIAGYELCDPHPIAWQNRRGSEVSG